MRKEFFVVLGLAVMSAVSCVDNDFSGRPRNEYPDYGKNEDSGGSGNQGLEEEAIYVSGVSYPEGYDWTADAEYGNVCCSLFVMKNGKRIVVVPAGHEFGILPDADMHRIVGGHLYTDYSDSETTVMKCDGEYLFSFEGREMIMDVHIDSTGVHTLGEDRSGQGWTYRINGQPVISVKDGDLLSLFHGGNDGLCFSYVEWMSSADGRKGRYYIVTDGLTDAVATKADVEIIHDIRKIGSSVYYVASLDGRNTLMLSDGTYNYELDPGFYFKSIRNPRIIDVKGEPCVTCEVAYRGESNFAPDEIYFTVFGKTGMTDRYNWHLSVNGYGISENGNRYCVASKGEPAYESIAMINGEKTILPEGYTAFGNPCFTVDSGESFHVIMKPDDFTIRPAIWKDGMTEEYDFNGYFTSIIFSGRNDRVSLPSR